MKTLQISSLAHVDPLCDPAFLTHNIATPVKAAVASFSACLHQNIVTSSAAKAGTAVHLMACLIAYSSLSTRRVYQRVSLTEVWRLFKEDKLTSQSLLVETRVEGPTVFITGVHKNSTL